jgi:cobalt-zinc-cadmium efflux system membrane fusion protein
MIVPDTLAARTLRSAGNRLPLWLQLSILPGLASIAVAALLVVPIVRSYFTAREERAAPALAPGTFRATDTQWASLKILPVKQTTFRAERVTDGKIANNDDTTTPVFSPYSGRVTKLFAKAGDYIERGAPLMAVAASEFVQGQNDLVAALQGLNTAHAQMRLATITEKRQHDLYDAKAGALKDWQQSQADFETAKSNTRTAEIALAAVCNRLRILGKSDDGIAAIVADCWNKREAELGRSPGERRNGDRVVEDVMHPAQLRRLRHDVELRPHLSSDST